jgi:hypothetical protein
MNRMTLDSTRFKSPMKNNPNGGTAARLNGPGLVPLPVDGLAETELTRSRG